MHVSDTSPVAEHCSVYALSDPSDSDLRRKCSHVHDEVCPHCRSLDAALKDIKEAAGNAKFHSDEERDECLHLFKSAQCAIHNWKCHQLRSVHQDQARLDALNGLNSESVMIVSDWAMKFLPQMYRESQADWFGKRGISWHISVAFRRFEGELQSQAFIHIIQSCSQDSLAVILMMQHTLGTLKREHPEITKAFLRQDNAGCYHSSSTILACPAIEKASGVKVVRLDFSDPQGGIGPADRLAATSKCHIRMYINEGHRVTTAQESKAALLSHGGLKGVRVAVVDSLDDSTAKSPQAIPGVSKLNNFEFTDGGLNCWRAYCIGQGRSCGTLKEISGDVFLPNLLCKLNKQLIVVHEKRTKVAGLSLLIFGYLSLHRFRLQMAPCSFLRW